MAKTIEIQQKTVVLKGIQFKIETNIPVPPEGHGYIGKWTTLYKSMRLNDSVLLPDRKASSALSQAAYHHKGRLATRKSNDGIRCWRIV